MSDLVALTGVSGFVGVRIAAEALNDGYRVRATLRNPKQQKSVRAWISHAAPTDNLEFVQADLLADDGWDEAITGVDYVIRLAMKLDISATKRDLNWQPMPFEQSVLDTARALEQKQSTRNGR